MASNHWSVPLAFNALRALTPLALWGRQLYEGISLMKASALGCPSRLPVASFPMMNIMETDGSKICRQPVSSSLIHVVIVKCQFTHGYSVYLFFFHITFHYSITIYPLVSYMLCYQSKFSFPLFYKKICFFFFFLYGSGSNFYDHGRGLAFGPLHRAQ